jgi:Cellulose binding domain
MIIYKKPVTLSVRSGSMERLACKALSSNRWTGFGGQIMLSNKGTTAIDNWTLSFNWGRAITDIVNAFTGSQ